MALAYFAPGVYVEEIPSARQPIAGVGTNTVGFIGLVPDEIYVPVPNPDYDPVLARTVQAFGRLSADATTADSAEAKKARDDLTAALAAKEAVVTTLTAKVAELDTDAKTKKTKADNDRAAAAADGAPPTAAATASRSTAQANTAATALANAQAELDTETANRDALKTKLDAAGAPKEGGGPPTTGTTGGGAVEVDDETYDAADLDADYLQQVAFRPYYLRKVTVTPDEFDTKLCTNFSEYTARFGDYSAFTTTAASPGDGSSSDVYKPMFPGHHQLTHAVDGFFRNGGTRCFVARVKSVDNWEKVLEKFESIDDVAIIAAPGLPKIKDVWEELSTYCEDVNHQNVFAVLDAPAVVVDKDGELDPQLLAYETADALLPRKSTHAAYYFPHIEVMDPAKRLQDSDPARGIDTRYRGRTYVCPSGHVAGIYARTDEERGVHKAPANATVRGALEVKYYVSKAMQAGLNPQGVNCIRLMNGDVTVWGARTIGGDRNGEWKYVNVRRFAGFLEESIDQGTQWVVFEPNDTRLWSRIVLNITSFLTNVWRSGALFGLTPQQAFYVKCDEELNPPEVRDLGMVITEIGVAIVRPAEFVIFRITQTTGQAE